jgi:hypothetical protein
VKRAPRPAAPPVAEPVLGLDAYAEAAQRLVTQARRSVVLMSVGLDPRAYGSPGFVDAVQTFALSNPRVRMRILLQQSRQAMAGGHRLVELLRRAQSRIEARQLLPEQRHLPPEEYLIVDERHLLQRAGVLVLEARLLQDAPAAVRPLLETFDRLWEESPPARELSELKL